MKRRKFVRNGIVGIGGLSILGSVYSWQVEPFWLEFVQRQISIANLPNNLLGKTIMQVSDMHVGNRFDYQYIIDSLKKASILLPDYVVYTGDFVTYENRKQIQQLREVMKFAVKGKLGTVAILGNHDYGHSWAQPEVANEISDLLEQTGITVLRNKQINIEGLHFIGIDDYWGTNFKPQQILKSIDPSKANIVLCHNPDVCDLPIWNNYQGWILAGHTHGGQVKPPFLNPPQLPVKNKKYTSGIIDLDDGRNLYINRALGHLIQVRFNVRPEITIFELKK